uniref:Uncharacterized protein n=1 Tax=Rhipicephalus zambeziensis TaxID=60191 RepID=A0A224YAR6_9ACAR
MLPMAEKYLFMCVILIVIIIARISVNGHNGSYYTCQGRERRCHGNTRPNCLQKNQQPYFQCTSKNQSCEDGWRYYCRIPDVLTCRDGRSYCDCFCLLRRRTKPGPRQKPNLWPPRTGY